MTKQEALEFFHKEVMPEVIKKFGEKDITAKREAWNDFTDSLCKNKEITWTQYENWTNPF